MSTEKAIPIDTSDDDLRAMGLPPAFTFDELKATFEDEEIAQMAEDGLVELPEGFKAPPKAERAADTINRREGDDPDDDGDETSPEVDETEDEVDETDDGDGEGEPEVDTEGDDETGDDAGGDAGDADKTAEPDPDPALDLRDDKDAREKVDAYDEKLTEIQDAYDEGDISETEFRDKIKALNADHLTAQRELDEIERHNTAQREAYASTWYDKVAVFMQDNPGLSDQTPIPGLSGAGALQVFDQALRHVTSDARFSNLSMDEKIAAAADIADAYAEQHASRKLRQAAEAKKAGPEPKAKEQKKAKAKPRQDPRPDPVQTLGNVSAATDTEIEDGRFAAIDRADALEAERLIAKLSEAEREAYLRGA